MQLIFRQFVPARCPACGHWPRAVGRHVYCTNEACHRCAHPFRKETWPRIETIHWPRTLIECGKVAGGALLVIAFFAVWFFLLALFAVGGAP